MGRDEQKPEFHSSVIGEEHCRPKDISTCAHHNTSRLKSNGVQATNQLTAVGSSSRSMVMLQDPTEDVLAFDFTKRHTDCRWRYTREPECAIVLALGLDPVSGPPQLQREHSTSAWGALK